MQIPASLAADVSILAQTLDNPDVDLEQMVRDFVCATKLAVGSYLGLSLHMVTGVGEFTLTVMEDSVEFADVVTSLHLPLQKRPEQVDTSTVTFYAGRAGALVDLAADLRWILDLRPDQVVLDAHLAVPERGRTEGQLERKSIIDQAIGVLIDDGRTGDEASKELQRRADLTGMDPLAVATRLLTGVRRNSGSKNPW